jgi:exodeoxyribonuclease VII large subunit
MELFPEKRVLTVTQATALIRGVLEDNFEHLWVSGEASNVGTPASGHVYFTVKDAGAQLRCVAFRGTARMLRFRIADGMGLIVRGRLSVYDQRGEYQLLVDYVEPQGIGALQTAFLQLKERLSAEGLFAEDRKKALPALPRRVGIVTSTSGAALHDMLTVIDRRYANLEILIRAVRVQGEGAAAEIAEAIGDLNRCRGVDVIIVGRGGGSLEDLWAFNEETVARAIARSSVPVISAVGHETDYTIADFVADLRAPTPSAAAELVVKSKDELAARVDALSHRLDRSVRHLLAARRGEFHRLACSLKDPRALLGHLGQRLDDLDGRLRLSFRSGFARRGDRVSALVRNLQLVTPALRIERCRERLISLRGAIERELLGIVDSRREEAAVATARLDALSPLKTLARGYAVVARLPEGNVVRDGGELERGETLRITFSRGSALCTVEEATDPPSLAAKP